MSEYYREFSGKRKFPRKNVNCEFRIYTSIKRGSYSSRVKDLSQQGAFIKTSFLPHLGEVITYELIDEAFKMLASGNAKVVWIKNNGPVKDQGFGVCFEEELDGDLFKKL